jgi:integrase/recombinase XerD
MSEVSVVLTAAGAAVELTQRIADVSGTAQLVMLWLHGKTKQTQSTYEKDVRYFVAFLTNQKALQVRLNDVDLRTVTNGTKKSSKLFGIRTTAFQPI